MRRRYNQITVILSDMELIDIPPLQNKFYIKAKQAGTEFTTDSIQVVKNTVKWPNPIKIDCEVPLDSTKRGTPLRLSFRYENASGSGFSRLGIVELAVTDLIINSNQKESQKIHHLLTNCKYNTYFDAKLI